MATEGERLARLEDWRRELTGVLFGDGGRYDYERSLEGRVTAVENALKQADALAAAARDLRRAHGRQIAGWAQVVLVICATLTAVAAVASAVIQLAQHG